MERQVGAGSGGSIGIITEESDRPVAGMTEQPTDFTGLMIMINAEHGGPTVSGLNRSTDGAAASLGFEDLAKSFFGEAVLAKSPFPDAVTSARSPFTFVVGATASAPGAVALRSEIAAGAILPATAAVLHLSTLSRGSDRKVEV